MFVQIIAKIPTDFFAKKHGNAHTTAKSKVRIIIKEHGGNWQDTVLRNKIGLAKDTKIVMNCFPGSKIDHHLIRQLTFIKTLQEVDEAPVELRQIFNQLRENHNTSPVKISLERYSPWYRFVNEKLWAKFHQLSVPSTKSVVNEERLITLDEWRLYQLVNKKYAKAVARDIVNDIFCYRNTAFDVNWLHDYQLMLVFPYLEHYINAVIEELSPKKDSEERTYRFSAEEKSRLYTGAMAALKKIKTSYFHHIPWPDVETFKAEFPTIEDKAQASFSKKPFNEKKSSELSHSSTSHVSEPNLSFSSLQPTVDVGREIIAGLLSCGHVAFQTEKDARHFRDCVHYYYPHAEMMQINAQRVRICFPDKKVDVQVNPIGTDYTLFSSVDFTGKGIVHYLGTQLNTTLEGIFSSEESNFTQRLSQIVAATKISYFNALTQAYLSELKEKKELLNQITELLIFENLIPTQLSETKKQLLALLGSENSQRDVLTDDFLKEAHKALSILQQAHKDLQDDYTTLEQLRLFKDNSAGTQLFTSIGRLDTEKNVPIVLDAYLNYIQECIFKKEPIKNSLLLFIVPSRLEVPAYRQELKSILEKYDAIKMCLAHDGKKPEAYVFLAEERLLREACANSVTTPSKPKLITPNAMAEFYRLGTVIISSRADGMNLVVKEWVAAQDRIIKNCLHALFDYVQHDADTSVVTMSAEEKPLFTRFAKALENEFPHHEHLKLVLFKLGQNFMLLLDNFFKQYQGTLPPLPMLSKNAGAAIQLKEACIIDPFDFVCIKEQFQKLSHLSPILQVARALDLKHNVARENGQEWRRSIVDHLLSDQSLDNSITQIARQLANGEGLIFIDYDGTIAPHVDNFNEAWPDKTARLALLKLMKIAPERIIFITGRDIASFEHCFWGGPESEHLQQIPLTVIGSHGLEIKRRNGKQESLLSLNELEQGLLTKLHAQESLQHLKIKLNKYLQQHLVPKAIDNINFDKIIEIKKYSIALSTRSLREFIKDNKILAMIEHQFAQILEEHYLKDAEGRRIIELSKFSVCQGIHTCELRYNFTKADAAQRLLTEDVYRNSKHITFMGDDFGLPNQPGTDYSLAHWIKSQDADPSNLVEGCVIQVISEENYEQQKQSVTSPALPDIVLPSPSAMGNVLNRVCEQATEIKSRRSLINQAIGESVRLIPPVNNLQATTLNDSSSIGLY